MKIIAALFFLSSAAAQTPDPLLWGSLKPGPHQVGFRSSIQFDPSRQYDAPYVPGARKPRPILADVWYPARANQQPRLHYRDYFEIPSTPAGASDFPARLSRFARETASQDIFQGRKPAQLTKDQQAAFDRFLSTPAFAERDAPPADGPFPVVIYHPGAAGSFEDNATLLEYLASHGYVVISSAYQSIDSTSVANNKSSSVHSIRDMAFLTAFAATLPFADAHHIAAMGHSAGAQAILRWIGEPDCPLDAAVSLDTTVEYAGLDSPTHAVLKKILDDAEGQPSVPILLFASTQHKPKFETWDDYLESAPRYFASIDKLTHNDYLLHGALYNTAEIRRGYDRVCALTLDFLDASLKLDRKARNALRKEPEIRYKAPSPAIPTARQFATLIQADGMAKSTKDLDGAPEVLYRGVIYPAALLLLEDGHIEEALALQHLYAKAFPKAPLAPLLLGEIEAARGHNDLAATAFKQALQLLKTDPDLSPIQKTIYENQIQTALGIR